MSSLTRMASDDPTEAVLGQVVIQQDEKFTVTEGNKLLRPPNDVSKVEIWLEQRIWGHRLYNDQTPWLLLLEALNMMAGYAANRNLDAIFPGVGEHHEMEPYNMQGRSELRHLLFRDRNLDEIAAAQSIADGSQWASWFSRRADLPEQFGYLRDQFISFNTLRNAIVLLRGAEVESERHRRPTSRHLAPRGVEMLTADYGESKNGTVNKDRRFFSRGGELLYLMLNRSQVRTALEPLVRSRLLGSESWWNKLAKALQPDVPNTPISIEAIGYLPLATHPAYERLAEDWLALLSLEALPDDSIPEPLMRLSGLGVLQYVVDRGADILGEKRAPFPIDMLGTETLNVQKFSKDCFARHRELSRKAIRKLVATLVESDEWNRACAKPSPRAALFDLSKRVFGFEPEGKTAKDIAEEIANEALSNHDQHLGRVVGFYAEQIGLTSARRGNGRWYAAADGMLEALVLVNVKAPMEYEAFLERLWRRYGLVIGSEAGRREFAESNYDHFKANQRLLEDRLRILGLLKRLSDDCAFVINPFYGKSEGDV